MEKTINKVNNKNKIEYITQVVMYFALTIYITILMIGNTVFYIENPGEFWNIIKQICCIVFFLKTLFDLCRGEKIPVIGIIFLAVSLLIYVNTNNSRMIVLFFIISATRNCNVMKIIKSVFILYSIIYILTIGLSLLNVIPDWEYTRGTMIRHSFGFSYSTITVGIYLIIVLMYCYIRRSKAKYIELIILQLINYILYVYTDGRLSFSLITLTLSTIAFYKLFFESRKQKIKDILNHKAIKAICCATPLILLTFMLLITYLYEIDNNIGIYLNKLFTHRLELNSSAFDRYDISLFGNKIKWNRIWWIWIYY